MPNTLPFFVVDAFAEQPYSGNPAGVVFDADGLSDDQMRRIAREVNASETAFISRANDLHRPLRLRWFTPTVEVGFCGHATLAASHALHASGRLDELFQRPDATLTFDTAAGLLQLRPEALPEPYRTLVWWLKMPAPGLKPENSNPVRTCELLGISVDDLDPAFPPMRTRDDDAIYFVRHWQTLITMQPRFEELAAWSHHTGQRGFCIATTETLSKAINVHSRFFCPAVGINEDPVTGSVHGPLAAYLVINGVVGSAAGKSGLFCAQGRPGDRGGLVRAIVESVAGGYRSTIGGQCFTAIAGEVYVPPA